MFTDYDIIIAGSGTAGLSAAIYTSRAGFSTLVCEKDTLGGESMNRQIIENYPGFANGIMGPELGSAMLEQAGTFGAEIETGEILSVSCKNSVFTVKTDGGLFTSKGVIIASGCKPRLLSCPGEDKFSGKGVYYCATCDGPLLAGKDVVVAGGGDSGITEALYLEKLGCKVTVIELLQTPKASRILLERAEENANIDIMLGKKILCIHGDNEVAAIEIQDVVTNKKALLEKQGILVRIGMIPNTEFIKGTIELSGNGQIPVNGSMETSIPGLFAAGDCRLNSPAQFGTAAGDGICAAMAFNRYMNSVCTV